MASSASFAAYVCEQVAEFEDVRARKMFGDYFVYIHQRPLLLICNDTVYVRTYPEIAGLMSGAVQERPFATAKPWWILDIDDHELVVEVVEISLPLTPIPPPKKRRKKKV
ncbi:MAG: TfoX/Sxy family protein [Corynebacterium sp.]|nr:TfoX/Sxy family protein [Corynebacterium sp.]